MKKYIKNIVVFMLIFTLSFMTLSNTAIASEHGGGGGANHGQLTEEEKRLKKLEIVDNIEKYLLFLCSQIGAYFNGSSYSDFYKNYVDYVKSTNDKWFEDNVSVSDDGKAVFSQDLMQSLKEYLDKYAKEHESYYIGKTYAFDTADFSSLFGKRNVYNTIKNLLNESKSGFIICSYYYDGGIWFADIDRNFADLSFVKDCDSDRLIGIYENDTWKRLNWKVYYIKLNSDDDEIKTAAEFKERATYTYSGSNWDYGLTQEAHVMLPQDSYFLKSDSQTIYSWAYLVSKEMRRVRVFNDFSDFQNYTLGKRKVYYTSNYYNYVPEDLSVSIDDLQKEVEDLSKVIDELLKQIQDGTDEKQIEELLKQILDALKNQQGTGGGGSGGGDVNVDIDLSTTNTLLSKILAKVTQIFDKMSSSAGQTMDSVVTAIEDLGKMLKGYLKTITGDLDDIKDKLDVISEQEFSEKTGSFMDEAKDSFSDVTDVSKTKFPFCIPNDFYKLLSKLSESPPSTGYPENGAVQTMDVYVSTGEVISVMSGHTDGTAQFSDTGAPVFHLPIVLERYGIDYTMVVDFTPFQPVANISRTFFVLIFIHGLLLLSIKIADLWSVMAE